MRTNNARIEKNNCVLVEQVSVMVLLFLYSLQDEDQNGYVDNNENRINGNKVGNQVDPVYGNHCRQVEIKPDYK